MKISSKIARGFEFEQYCVRLFNALGYEVDYSITSNQIGDFTIKKNGSQFDVDIKYSKNINNDFFKNATKRMEKYKRNFIFVTTGYVSGKHTQNFIISSESIIIDIADLLYIVQNNAEMKNELLEFIDFNTDKIEVKESDSIRRLKIKQLPPVEISYNQYIQRLEDWRITIENRQNSNEFEKLCTEVLRVLFPDDLALWKEQQKSNDDLYRFDLVCRIKDNITTGFWNLLENRFNSKYIIFEYKNYAKKITQKEIYTTEKYLYLKALRSVAFIISRKGADKNADIAIRGCLRENGKLIISLTIDDLIKMLNEKSKGFDPSEYLYEILDCMLLDLEK